MKKRNLFSPILCLGLVGFLFTGCTTQSMSQKTAPTVASVESTTAPSKPSHASSDSQQSLNETNLTSNDSPQPTSNPTTPAYKAEQNKKDQATTTQAASAPQSLSTLDFVDAWGEWHHTTILPNVKKHSYQWDFLTNNGQDIAYDDAAYEMIRGIDVSHHQGDIDWEKVKADGYDFAFIRMAYRGYGEEGVLRYDKKYKENIKNAQAAGLAVGVYIFSQAINEEEALEEAAFVLDGLQDYSLDLPVVYDPELIRDDVARTDDVSGEQFTKNTIAFCEEIQKNGYEPMVYSNMVWEAELFDLTKLQSYPIWYADYEPAPQTPYAFSFWQYTEKGHADGVDGVVDLDVYFQKKQSPN